MINTLHSNLQPTRQSADTLLQGTASNNSQGKAQSTLLEKLANHIPGMAAKDFNHLDRQQFTPEKVAERISTFVARGLEAARQNGRSEEEIQQLYNAAVKGVEKGIAEAREILDGLGVLSGQIATDVDQTETLTHKKLGELNPARHTAVANYSQLLGAARYQQAESLSLTVQTQDGDKVSINFSHSSRLETVRGQEHTPRYSAEVFDISRSESSQYHFSIDGNLDNQEIDALQSLINDMADLSNEFFNGDLQSAFEMASQYDMDNSQLAAMSLRLTQTTQSAAASQYQRVEQLDQPPSAKKLGHLLQDISTAAQRPELGFLENAQDLGQQLLDNLTRQDIRYSAAEPEKQARYDQHLNMLTQLLASQQTTTGT